MEFRIEKASAEDYQLFADIIQEVWNGMEQRAWFMADNADYTYEMLSSGKGTGYKAVETESGDVAGIFMATAPGMDESNLGWDIGLSEKELPLAAHMDSAAILPRYRGYGLQRLLMQEAEKDLRSLGFRYLLCTVHPDNRYSLDNVLKQGYQIMTVKEKYGGNIRAVLKKDLF